MENANTPDTNAPDGKAGEESLRKVVGQHLCDNLLEELLHCTFDFRWSEIPARTNAFYTCYTVEGNPGGSPPEQRERRHGKADGKGADWMAAKERAEARERLRQQREQQQHQQGDQESGN
jgi:hypothetical protein